MKRTFFKSPLSHLLCYSTCLLLNNANNFSLAIFQENYLLYSRQRVNISKESLITLQVNLCQKLLFLYQLTHNMTTDCSLNYKINTWKFQAQTKGEHVLYRNCFWHSEQFLYTTCSPHVLQKEELLIKIYLYIGSWISPIN